MGMYDTIFVPCPKCGTKSEFQSKSGDCLLDVYNLSNCPDDVLQDVNRHAPNMCKNKDCRTYFSVDIKKRIAVEVALEDLDTPDSIDSLSEAIKKSNVKITFGIQDWQIKRIEEERERWNNSETYMQEKIDIIYSTNFWEELGREFAWHPFTLALYYFQYCSPHK